MRKASLAVVTSFFLLASLAGAGGEGALSSILKSDSGRPTDLGAEWRTEEAMLFSNATPSAVLAQPATRPPALAYHRLAYDSESDRVILFAGRPNPIFLSDETWAYDFNSGTWLDMNPMNSPAARAVHAMTYDTLADRVQVFGGIVSAGATSDTWSYDFNTDTWSSLAPATRPSLRLAHRMAPDIESGQVILFGGGQLPGTGVVIFLNDTWAFNATTNTWTEMSPAVHPIGRVHPGMAYDPESDRVILFGGATEGTPGEEAGFQQDTWAYDFNTNAWTNMNPVTKPSARFHHAMTYDTESDRVILFGGFTGTSSNAETWAYDFNGNAWTLMSPLSQPTERRRHAMTYDTESDRVILFGGDASGFVDDTWAYDLNTDTWTDVTPATFPSAPRSLQGTAGDAVVDLSWNPPTDDGGAPVLSYRLHRGIASGNLAFLMDIPAGLTHRDDTASNGVTYFYAVQAVNDVGEGPLSNEVAVTPMATMPPPDTTNPMISITSPSEGATLGSTSARVTGTASDDVAVDQVELSTDMITWSLAIGTTSWSGDVTLAEGANTIFARATDTSGNPATASVSITLQLVGEPPPGEAPSLPFLVIAGVVAAAGAVVVVVAILLWQRRGSGPR